MNVKVLSVYGFHEAIRAMRMPYESFEKSDSGECTARVCTVTDCPLIQRGGYCIGHNDKTLAKALVMAGSSHRTFLRFIQVYMEVDAPRFWWAEMDRYRIGKEQISSSTMHLITKRPITVGDFEDSDNGNSAISNIVEVLNDILNSSLLTEKEKKYELKRLLPESFIQKRLVMFSYETLLSIYEQRKNHELPQWHEFCEVVETLPYMEDFLGAIGAIGATE